MNAREEEGAREAIKGMHGVLDKQCQDVIDAVKEMVLDRDTIARLKATSRRQMDEAELNESGYSAEERMERCVYYGTMLALIRVIESTGS